MHTLESELMCLACIHRQPIAKLKEKIIDWIFWCVWPVNLLFRFDSTELLFFFSRLVCSFFKLDKWQWQATLGERINVKIACIFRLAARLNETVKPMKLYMECWSFFFALTGSQGQFECIVQRNQISTELQKAKSIECANRFTAIDRDRDNFRYNSKQ